MFERLGYLVRCEEFSKHDVILNLVLQSLHSAIISIGSRATCQGGCNATASERTCQVSEPTSNGVHLIFNTYPPPNHPPLATGLYPVVDAAHGRGTQAQLYDRDAARQLAAHLRRHSAGSHSTHHDSEINDFAHRHGLRRCEAMHTNLKLPGRLSLRL